MHVRTLARTQGMFLSVSAISCVRSAGNGADEVLISAQESRRIRTEVTSMGSESHNRYDQLKESVRVLRAQVRTCRKSERSPHDGTALVTSHEGLGTALTSPSNGPVTLNDGFLEDIDPQESFSMQHLRLQFKLELQKKKEEIKKLIANQRGRSQQIENLENEHKMQRRKLEARIEHQSEKICALEAQLSNRITLHQQELQAQAYAFSAKLRQLENEKCHHIVAVRMEHVASAASIEEHHRAELSQAQVIYGLSLKRAEDAEAKVKALEAELGGLKQRMADTKDLLLKKDEECCLKTDRIKASYEGQVRDLRARLKKEKDELERVKMDLTKRHTLELQSYKMQKAREIDQVSERVRAAVESKDASISLLKEELAKQQEQAAYLLDIS